MKKYSGKTDVIFRFLVPKNIEKKLYDNFYDDF